MSSATASRVETQRRSRKGCRTCRARRVKCDKNFPCGYCSRRGLECKQTDLIVYDRRSELSSTDPGKADDGPRTVRDPSGHNTPESTYDVFRQSSSVVLREPIRTTQLQNSHSTVMTEEVIKLLEVYQKGIGVWMDVLDHAFSFQQKVVRLALSYPLLLHSTCALSAKQMSLVGERFLWEPVSARHYGTSLRLLIKELNGQHTSREAVVAATILLCSYELLALPGEDYGKHLYGARSLFQTHNITATGTSLEIASFWIFARQDVSMALVRECPTLIPPRQWPVTSRSKEKEEDDHGKRILWLLAKMLNFRFSPGEACWSPARARDFRDLTSEIDIWWENLPLSARGVTVVDESDEQLSKTWFYSPSAATACLYYHMTKILSLECLLLWPAGAPTGMGEVGGWRKDAEWHAASIVPICSSTSLYEGALVVAVNPLYYAAKYTHSLSVKATIWALLDHIEVHLGFHTRSRIAQSQKMTTEVQAE